MAETTLQEPLALVRAGSDLDTDLAVAAARALADPEVSPEQKRDFLLALADKGETASEVAAFASYFRSQARDPGLGDLSDGIDIVGTGGDHSGSFNFSTTSALVAAAGGLRVIKHGNRSVTSKCGSADFLEALGVKLDADGALLQRALKELNFVFLFAPAYHPAFREIVPVRKALAAEGHRTVFNLLGPLINPGRPGHMLMGVFSSSWVGPLAESFDKLGTRSALVVNCELSGGGVMDELSCAGANHIAGAGAMRGHTGTLSLAEAGLSACPVEDLQGGDASDNIALLEKLLSGQAPRGLEDTVCLNAGAAFFVAGRVARLADGVAQAREILTGGALASWLKTCKAVFSQ